MLCMASIEEKVEELSTNGSWNTKKTSKGGGYIWHIYQNTMSRTCS